MPHQCTTCGHVFDDGSKEMLSGCPDCGGNTFQFHPKGTEIPETPPDADPPEPEGSTAANTVGRAATKVRDFVSNDDGSEPDSAAGAPERPPAEASAERSSGDTAPTGSASPAASGTEARGSSPEPSGASPDPNATWPSEQGAEGQEPALEPDDDGIIDADAREAARAVGEADEGADDPASESGAPEARTDTAADGPDTGAGPVSGARSAGGIADDGPSDGRVVSEPDGDQPDISELREQLNDQFESIKILEPGQYELNLMELYDREEYIIALQENGRYVIQVPEQWLGDQPGDA
ncbi:Zn-ribbon domain-containing protein [Haloglomus litoreum]|uniref:Zn-ribbon domain-containing protein n=1 Tax=Haloglomus litoreum TaxID=3034026 RepID=UPI0023E7D68D|nr:Zn-ribbon containing protein [Haloglomus sp. DT116]